MNTKSANAPSTNSTRFRISGTRSAARRLFSNEFLYGRSGGFERFFSRTREEHVAETQSSRQRLAGFVCAQNLYAVANRFDLLGYLERLRRNFHRRIPIAEIAEIDYGIALTEMSDVASFLRIA